MGKDLRRHARKSLVVEFKGTDVDGTGRLVFDGVDLSSGGTFLKTDLLLEKDERLRFEFHLPGSAHTVTALARVAWVRRFPKDEEPAGMGIEFLSMSDQDRDAVHTYLQQAEPAAAP